jgi:hypothetical protein
MQGRKRRGCSINTGVWTCCGGSANGAEVAVLGAS